MNTPSPVFRDIHARIREAGKILVVADGKPDGDSIGSSSAFVNWLTREGKPVTAFCAEKVPRALQFLDGVHAYTDDPAVFAEEHDLILTFDASDLKHCGIEEHLPLAKGGRGQASPLLVVFDHHATNKRFGHVNAVFTDACSTCEVVYRFFDELGIVIDHKMATSLLTGIHTDTGSFSNSATNVAGLDAASQLVAAGARQADIIKNVFSGKSVDALKLCGLALERLQALPKNDMVFTYFLKEDLQAPGSEEAVDGISNFLNASCGASDAILVLRDAGDGVVKGSLRSISRDISKLAQMLGGGGHKKAAGFSIPGTLKVENGRVRVVSNPSI